jgi:hypothetical protein
MEPHNDQVFAERGILIDIKCAWFLYLSFHFDGLRIYFEKGDGLSSHPTRKPRFDYGMVNPVPPREREG